MTSRDSQNMSVQEFLFSVHSFSHRIITRLKQNKGDILLNGCHVRMVDPVKIGDVITVKFRDQTYCAPNYDLKVDIIHEDEDVIVFNKPANMPVHPSRNHQTDTLANFYTAYMLKKGLSLQFRPINRLDRDTMGLCVVSKNALSAKVLSDTLEKEYTAVVCGVLPTDSGVIDLPIIRPDDFYIERAVCLDRDNPKAQSAVTRYTVISRSERYTKVRIKLDTGRTHQIRVHFSHIGHPLVGDTMYGGNVTNTNGYNGNIGVSEYPHQMLLCSSVSFISPYNNIPVNIAIDFDDTLMHNYSL